MKIAHIWSQDHKINNLRSDHLVLFWLFSATYMRFHLVILSEAISPLISSSILGTYRPGKFSVLSFCLFMLCMGFSRQEYGSSLPFPSPVDYILSEVNTKTHPNNNKKIRKKPAKDILYKGKQKRVDNIKISYIRF